MLDWDVLHAANSWDNAHLHQLFFDGGRISFGKTRQQVPILGPRLWCKPLKYHLFWYDKLKTISVACMHHLGKQKLVEVFV